MDEHPPILREKSTVRATVALYCRDLHGARPELCPDCQDLLRYAHTRLERCVYGGAKPTCAHCPIHCYRPDVRARMRTVMRYAGPRMLLDHPVLALLHVLDGWRKAPEHGHAYD